MTAGLKIGIIGKDNRTYHGPDGALLESCWLVVVVPPVWEVGGVVVAVAGEVVGVDVVVG